MASKALVTAAPTSSSLVAKTLKIVPSATPAACAICRVLTSVPWARTSDRVEAMSAARRSSGGRGDARGEVEITRITLYE